MNVPVKLVLQITGTVLGLAGTVFTGIASNKAMEDTISKKVAEEVTKQLNK